MEKKSGLVQHRLKALVRRLMQTYAQDFGGIVRRDFGDDNDFDDEEYLGSTSYFGPSSLWWVRQSWRGVDERGLMVLSPFVGWA